MAGSGSYVGDLYSFMEWLSWYEGQQQKNNPDPRSHPYYEEQPASSAGSVDWGQTAADNLGWLAASALPPALLLLPNHGALPGLQYQKPSAPGSPQGGAAAPAPGSYPGASTLTTAANGLSFPFPAQYNYVSGNDYGAQVDPNSRSGGYGPVHLGIDYGTPAGTSISAPLSGTVSVQYGLKDYGNLVTLTLDNGWKIRFGHVAQGYFDGQRVNAGQTIALSGANVGDSQGAVTLVEWMDPNGGLHNPHDVLDPIFAGATLTQLQQSGALTGIGPGMKTYTTPEGVRLDPNTPLGQAYSFAQQVWSSTYGVDAPLWAAEAFQKAGVQNEAQLKAVEYNLPSDIAGLSMGQRQDLQSIVNSSAEKYFGRAVPDSLISQFASQGIKTPAQVDAWFLSHPASAIGPEQYGQVYDALAQHTGPWASPGSTTSSAPSPDMVMAVYNDVTGIPGRSSASGGVPPRPF